MRLYYRISDKSYPKTKLPGANKEFCLMDFAYAFASVIFTEDDDPPLRIFADNCHRTTIKMIAETGLPLAITAEGNAGSFRKALATAIEEARPDEIVYFCEDDYLHRPHASVLLAEGLERADYVTLYDHPDKYTSAYDGGEVSQVFKTKSSHWRQTISTCMTFGAKAKTLAKDIEVFKEFTSGDHPNDHGLFVELGMRCRKLAVCIPGAACHTDLTVSGGLNQVAMEPWAIEALIKRFELNLEKMDVEEVCKGKTGWERLVMLGTLAFETNKSLL